MLSKSVFLKPEKNPLPATSGAYLQFIRDYVRENKVPPSFDDMAAASGLSRSSARQAVDRLIRKGYLRRGPGHGRNLIITPSGIQILSRKPKP